MKRFSKISIDDIKNIQVDSGVLLKEFDVESPVFLPENVICATSGGINPVCAPEYYDFSEDVDNAKSSKETKRIRGWNATISFTTLTTSLTAIKLALGAADISGKVLSLRQRLQYAKDFNDIWWVGKRADDKLLAIRLIRSLSDSGFSLQTRKGGKGQISVTLKGHSSFAEPNKIPMEVYIFAENDIPILPDEPDTPTASMYLYGRPSESGNIGLRNGESVTLYDGAVLPPLPESDLQYMTIFLQTVGGEKYWELITSSVPFGASNYGVCGIKDTVYYTAKCDFDTVNTQWSDLEQSTTTYRNSYSVPKWANYKLTLNDGTVVQYSDPIPVYTGMVGYSYNGTVLPDIYSVYTDEYQEQYPNAVIFKGIKYGGYDLSINLFKPYLSKDGTRIVLRLSSNSNLRSVFRKSSWASFGTSTNQVSFTLVDENGNQICEVIWANCDIKGLDGSTYITASDPIPVYE